MQPIRCSLTKTVCIACNLFLLRKQIFFLSPSFFVLERKKKKQNAWGSGQLGPQRSVWFSFVQSLAPLPSQQLRFLLLFSLPRGLYSPVVVIPAETLKVHSRCSSKPSAEGKRALTHLTLISSISTITNLSSSLITVMVTSTIKAAVSPGKGFWDCVDIAEVGKSNSLVKKKKKVEIWLEVWSELLKEIQSSFTQLHAIHNISNSSLEGKISND